MKSITFYDRVDGISVVKHWLTTAAHMHQTATVKNSLTVQMNEQDQK